MIVNTQSWKCPIIKERHCFYCLTWIINKCIPSIYFIDNCNVNHSHDHNPKINNIFKLDKLSNSFILSSKDSFINMLKRKHPCTIHHIRDKHSLILESIYIVYPFIEVVSYHNLFCSCKWFKIIKVKECLWNKFFIFL